MFWNKKKQPNFVVVDCVNNCLKDKCPKWVILYHNITDSKGNTKQVQEGKCADAWLPILLAEISGKLNANKN